MEMRYKRYLNQTKHFEIDLYNHIKNRGWNGRAFFEINLSILSIPA